MRRAMEWSNSKLCENCSSKVLWISSPEWPSGLMWRRPTERSACLTPSAAVGSSGEVYVISIMSLGYKKYGSRMQGVYTCIQSFDICRTSERGRDGDP